MQNLIVIYKIFTYPLHVFQFNHIHIFLFTAYRDTRHPYPSFFYSTKREPSSSFKLKVVRFWTSIQPVVCQQHWEIVSKQSILRLCYFIADSYQKLLSYPLEQAPFNIFPQTLQLFSRQLNYREQRR